MTRDFERIDQLEKDVKEIRSKLWFLVGQYNDCLNDAIAIINILQKDYKK